MFTWGFNIHGQLGDGTTTQRLIPTLIGTDTWRIVSAGVFHSIGIRADNRLFTWGANFEGAIGDGTTIDRHVPTLIGTDTWNVVSGGEAHSLGIKF